MAAPTINYSGSTNLSFNENAIQTTPALLFDPSSNNAISVTDTDGFALGGSLTVTGLAATDVLGVRQSSGITLSG